MSPMTGTGPVPRPTTRRRARRLAASAGGLLAIALALLALPAPASAAPGDPVTPLPDALATLWDHPTDSLNLAWDGSVYGRATGSFIGQPLAVPGDQIWRTLNVTNAGPDDADLTVRIINAVTEDPEGVVNTDFEDISIIHWDVAGTRGNDAFRDVRLGDPLTLAVIPVAKGETVPVTIGYEFPFDEITGRNLGQASQILRFDVEFILRGDTPPSPANTTETTTATDTGTGQPNATSTGSKPGGMLPVTGVAIGGTALAAGLAIALGLLLARRRRQESTIAPAPRHIA